MEDEEIESRIEQLGFKPQKEIVYNRFIPNADKIDQEAIKELNVIKTNLVKCLLRRELKPGVFLWTQRLDQYIKLFGLMFSKEDHIRFVKFYLELLKIKNQEPSCITKWCSTITILLKKRYLLSRDDLQIDWRPIYDLFLVSRNSTKSEIGYVKGYGRTEGALSSLAKYCRTYIPAEATKEILDQCKPTLCPFNEQEMIDSIFILELLLPVSVKVEEAAISYELWFSEFMDLWNACINDGVWESSVLSLMAALSCNNIGHIDWEPHIPTMYARFSRSFQLPVNYKMRTSGKNHNLEVNTISLWIISSLNHKSPTSFQYLEQFLQMIKSFLYTANVGRWTLKLKELLYKLSFHFVNRIYMERYKPASWEKVVPDDFKLDDDDIDRFVTIIKPCVELAMFSRRMCNDINLAFQHLAALRPNLIIPMTLDKLYASLDSVTEPHKLISAMSAVMAVARHISTGAQNNYPEGPTHVIPLLMAVLPGVDPNDIRKCLTTFQFISHFVSMIPLINSSEAGKYYDDLTEEEHTICEATANFEDFVVQFFDRICVWIESCSLDFVRPEQQSSELNVRGGLEYVSEHALSSVAMVILRQTSPEIFAIALKKVFNFTSSSLLEVNVAGKLLAVLCSCFSKVNPKESLRLFVPYLCDKVDALIDENPNFHKEEHLDGELLYNLLILSEVVDAQNEILQYISRLMKILDRTLHVSCVQATKISTQMLNNIILALISVHPIERKSSSKDYSLHVKDFLSIREWGHSIKVKDLTVEWYRPGAIEIETVRMLVNKYLSVELDNLNKYCNNEIQYKRTELRNCLKIVNSILVGNIHLPIWNETPIQLAETTPNVEPYRAFEMEMNTITMEDGSNIRKLTADTLHRVQKKLLETDEGDTKSFEVISNIYSVLMFNKQNLELEQNWKNFSMVKKFSQNRLLDRKRHLRCLLINRTFLQYSSRIANTSYQFTETHRQIVLDLFELSVSRYREVRLHSQHKLLSIINNTAYSYRLIIDNLKEVLQINTSDHHDKFKGCLYVLNTTKYFPIIVRQDWKFILEIWPLVISSMPSEKPSIVNMITYISETVFLSFQTPPIDFKIPDEILLNAIKLFETLLKGTDVMTEMEESAIASKKECEIKKARYIKCIDQIMKLCVDGKLHWRHHLLALGFIRDLVHVDVNYNKAVIKYFLNALIDDSILIRKIALKVVIYILIQNKLQYVNVAIDPFSLSNCEESEITSPGYRKDNEWLLYKKDVLPQNSEQWNELRFLNHESLGYYKWPKELKVPAAPKDQPTVADNESDRTPEQNEIYSFFLDHVKLTKLIKYLSLEEKKGKDLFNIYKALLFKYLSKLMEDKALDVLLPHLKRLGVEKQESSQRCAAEITAGLIRGSKHWSFEKTVKLWSEIIPIIQRAQQNILVETVQDWSVCLSVALRHRDSRRYHWLIEFLLDDPLGDSTSLIAGVKMHLLSNVVYQQMWRNCEIYVRLLDYLKKHMMHPFQLIRHKVSLALKGIFARNYLPTGDVGPKIPKIEEFFKEYMPTLDWLYNDTLKKVDNNYSCDKSTEAGDDQKENAIRLYKIVSKFITSSLICRSNLRTPIEYYQILPLTCVLQSNDVDDEIPPICMNVLAVLAQSIVVEENIPALLDILETTLSCPLWCARAALAEFLSCFVFHNMAILSSRVESVHKIKSFVLILLEDTKPEVRENACKFLSGLLHSNFLPDPSDLMNQFKQKARTKLKKVKNPTKSSGINTGNLITRHAGVLGLCAFISSTPYDIPEFLPDIFGVLGPHLSDPQPIPSTIRKTLCDFKRTHQDNWEAHKMQFTEEQLLVFRDLTVPPSYYV